jgi:hypothetical protein
VQWYGSKAVRILTFGAVNDPDKGDLVIGDMLDMNATNSLRGTTIYNVKPNFFTRHRPKYKDLGSTQVLDARPLELKVMKQPMLQLS